LCQAKNRAVALADAWSIIEATSKMVDAFIGWIKSGGIEASLAYFEHIAMNLAEVEVSWDHDAGEPFQDDADDDADDGFDLSGDPDEAYREEIPDLYAYHVIGYDELAEAMDLTWEERQPRYYKALLRKVRCIADLDTLRDLGKRVPGSASGGNCSTASGRMTKAATTASWRSGRGSSNFCAARTENRPPRTRNPADRHGGRRDSVLNHG
jgi:hypothetical protein